MPRLIVKAKLLNKRSFIPAFLPEPKGLSGIVKQNFIFEGEEVTIVPNPALGKWYKDRDNHFYWGGALDILEAPVDEQAPELTAPDNAALETISITPLIKKKIEQVINAFETGSAEGNYGTLVKLKDYEDPATHTRIVQVTFGRSQTTEFGHLKSLIQDYVMRDGKFAAQLQPYLQRIGNKPSLATDTLFCDTLKEAGRNDPIMKVCQDELFDAKYYQPAHSWFTANKFTLPLSLLVIYDSKIHSGGILGFLRKKFSTNVPASGGNEKEWIANYVNARHNWLSGHSDPILRKTVYRTECFRQEIQKGNWDLSKSIDAHGVKIV